MPWWYELTRRRRAPGPLPATAGGFASSSSTGWRRSRPPTRSSCPAGTATRQRRSSPPSAPRTPAARGWSRSAAGPSSSPRPACSTAARRRRTGATPPALAERHPEVRVNADVLYVDAGSVLTSAGSAAGIDLCLHIVRRDHGAAVANAVARRLVIPPHRDGGQAQLIEPPMPAHPDDDPIARVMAWALERLRRAARPRGPRGPRVHERAHVHAPVPQGDRARPRAAGCSSSACARACRCSRRRTRRSRPSPGRSASRVRRRTGITSPRSCARRRRPTGARSTRPRSRWRAARGRGAGGSSRCRPGSAGAWRPRCSRTRRRRRRRRPRAGLRELVDRGDHLAGVEDLDRLAGGGSDEAGVLGLELGQHGAAVTGAEEVTWVLRSA